MAKTVAKKLVKKDKDDKKKKKDVKVIAKATAKPAPKVLAKDTKKPIAKAEAKTSEKQSVSKKPVAPTKATVATNLKASAKSPMNKMQGATKKSETLGDKRSLSIERPVPKFLDDLPDTPVAAPTESKQPRELHSSDLFSEEELMSFLQMLKSEKEKLLEKAKNALGAGNIAIDKDEMYDEVDLASATIEQNLTFKLLDRDRKLLGEIEHAIDKIHSGEFGYCEGTGEAIPKRRLELRPWTRHSVKYKEQLERMKKSGRGVVDEDELA